MVEGQPSIPESTRVATLTTREGTSPTSVEPNKLKPTNKGLVRFIPESLAIRLGLATSVLVGGGAAGYFIQTVLASENPSETDINSFSNSFNNGEFQVLPYETVFPPAAELEIKQPETKDVNPKQKFDNTKDNGVSNPINAIQMTAENYSRLDIPLIEEDSINIPFTVVTEDGQMRSLNWRRRGNEIRVIGGKEEGKEEVTPIEVIHLKNKIVLSGLEKSNIFKSPITGKIHHTSSREKPDGITSGPVGYTIEGVDEKGNKITLYILAHSINQIMRTPRSEDYMEIVGKTEIPDGRGGTFMADAWGIVGEIPEVIVKVGDPIFALGTESNHPFFPGQIQTEAFTVVNDNTESRRGGAATINFSTTQDGHAIGLR